MEQERALFGLSAFLLWAVCTQGAELQQPVLTNAAQVHALSPSEAGKKLPVRLRGVVAYQIENFSIFLHDATHGIYVDRSGATNKFVPFQFVEVEGVTAPGEFAPVVKARNITALGEGNRPVPRRVTFDHFALGQLDCRWVELSGIVRSVQVRAPNKIEAGLAVGGGRLAILLDAIPSEIEPKLIASTIQVQGVMTAVFNQRRQFIEPLLLARGTDVVLKEAPAQNDLELPYTRVANLLQYNPDVRPNHRAKVQGTVLMHQIGRAVFLRDGNRGLMVKSDYQKTISPGTIVETIGFPAMGKYSPLLDDAVIQITSKETTPQPVKLNVEDALKGRHDSDLISVEASLVETEYQNGIWQMVLQDSDNLVSAELQEQAPSQHIKQIQKGSRVLITGVCAVDAVNEIKPQLRPVSFQLLLRSADDLVVLQNPPWWNSRRLFWALGLVSGTFLLSFGALFAYFKIKLMRQTTARLTSEAEFAGVSAERIRLARELHDSLEQGLTGIGLQLDAVAKRAEASDKAAKHHLELARTLTQQSQEEVRRCINDLRAEALESNNLPGAFSRIIEQLGHNTRMSLNFRVEGDVQNLPPVTENHLLRIGQEGLANALKHSCATRIWVTLSYQSEYLLLSIDDDGCGLNPSELVKPKDGHFGLRGMSERARRIGAGLNIKSTLQEGTTVELRLPIRAGSFYF